ncbi:dnaJ homolog subfamily B member 9-like [Gadus macrocephalus]|uniref:dnaJ homolog subfamily B member 9-like n=1 Tax=Gadus macrocephalus TaxID=80720 RepID=UPI0028CB19DB|nr:dnaJ homolog subfamily B member 9-like [Gadus macrocephalus]
MSQQSVYLWTLLWIASRLCASLETQNTHHDTLDVQKSSLKTQKTHYDTLEIQRTATDRQIQKAFHKLAVKFHPDKNKSSGAEKIFREIVEAYEVLSNQDSRRTYDYLGHEAFLQDDKDFHHHHEEHSDEDFFHFDFDDFFSSLGLDDEDDDDDLFLDEPLHHSWGFSRGGEDLEALEEERDILDHIFFDTREQHYYYGLGDDDDDEEDEEYAF